MTADDDAADEISWLNDALLSLDGCRSENSRVNELVGRAKACIEEAKEELGKAK